MKTAASAFFCVYGIIASSEGPSAWRQACALPRCESRYFHTDRKKPIIRTHLLPETSSDYIGLVIAVGVEPKQAEQDACRMDHAISDESFAKLKMAIDDE